MSNDTTPARRKQTTERLHTLDTGLGKVHIERRNGAPKLYARAHIQGAYLPPFNTGRTTLKEAIAEAGRWFHDRYRESQTTHLHSRPFSACAKSFLAYADTELIHEISDGQREQYHIKWKVLEPHFDGVTIADVDAMFLRRLRDTRAQAKTQRGTLVKPATIKKDLVLVRLVLKHAKEHLKCIDSLPEFPSFRGALAVIEEPTPFLTLREFNKLMAAADALTKEPDVNARILHQRRELYAFIMISVGACLRVDEAYSLRWMDCKETKLPNAQKQDCVHMMVKSKKSRGKGESRERLEAWGVYSAVKGFRKLKQWTPDRKATDPLFIERHADALTKLLKNTDLYVSKHSKTIGQPRNAKSFRHTGMSLLLELSTNPDVNIIASIARTSPEMVRRWYDQNLGKNKAAKVTAFRGDPKG
jgi:integrase